MALRQASRDLLILDGASIGPISLATSQTLAPINITNTINLGIQLFFTGTPAGTFTLQISNDPGRPMDPIESKQTETVTHWSDVEDSDETVSAAGNLYYNIVNTGGCWMRVVYTASGTGTTPSLIYAMSHTKGV